MLQSINSCFIRLDDDIKVSDADHGESRPDRDKFRDILKTRSQVSPKSHRRTKKEQIQTEEPNEGKKDITLPMDELLNVGAEVLYGQLIIPSIVPTPAGEEILYPKIPLISQYVGDVTDDVMDVIKETAFEGEADHDFNLAEEAVIEGIPSLVHRDEIISSGKLHDNETLESVTEKVDIPLIKSETGDGPIENGLYDNDMEANEPTTSGPAIEELALEPDILVRDKRFLENDAKGQMRDLEQVFVSSDDEDPGNSIRNEKAEIKFPAEAPGEYATRLDNAHDGGDPRGKGLSDNDDDPIYNRDYNSDYLSNTISDAVLDFSKVLDAPNPEGKIEFIEQLAEKAVVTLGNGKSALEIEVKPNHLGKLLLKVAVEDGNLTGRIYTDNRDVRDFLQRNLDDLWSTLKDQGLVFTSLDVNVGEQPSFDEFRHLKNVKSRARKIILANDIPLIKTGEILGSNRIDFFA